MGLSKAEVVIKVNALKPLDSEERAEDVLKHFNPGFEAIENHMCDAGIRLGTAFEHPALYLLLRLRWAADR